MARNKFFFSTTYVKSIPKICFHLSSKMQRTAVVASKLAPPSAADPRPRYVFNITIDIMKS